MSLYIWYSGATDVTGEAIAEALASTLGERNVSHGRNFPTNNPDLLVCYGCKPGDSFDYGRLNGLNILNHPRKIRANVNKFSALEKMRAANVQVADFVLADDARRNGLPDIGQKLWIARKKQHQGGKGVVLVYQKSDIQHAIDQGMEYFQVMVPKDTEYRVHVMGGELLFAVKKVLQDNPFDNWRAERKELIEKRAGEQNTRLDEATLALALDICGKSMRLPDNLVRGLKRGWKFSSLNNPAAAIRNAAIEAVRAVELDFGAVDIMKGDDGNFYVIEVNSGPGLKGQNIDRYRDAIRAKYEEATRRPATREDTPARERTTRVRAEEAPPAAAGGRGNLAGMVEEAAADIQNMNADERRDFRNALLEIAQRL